MGRLNHDIKVSIVVAAYNAEAFVGRCLLSLLAQTEDGIEVILVDDGSSDDTLGVARGVARQDGRLRILAQAHQGVSAARNRGLQEVRGAYVAFVDADDYVHPQYVEMLLRALSDHPEAELALSPSVCTSAERDVSMSLLSADQLLVDGERLLRGLFVGMGRLSVTQCHVCHGKLFRRSLLSSLSFPVRYAVCEDAVFMCQVYQRTSQAVWVDARLYFWYQHAGSALHSGLTPGRIDSLLAYRECYELVAGERAEVRAACLRRLVAHGQWLRQVATGEERRAVERVARQAYGKMAGSAWRGLWREVVGCDGLNWRQRLELLLLPHSRRLRQRFFNSSRNAPESSAEELPPIGPAPEETNGVVSVVIPVYNMAPWLRECIDSVVAQKYRRLEIILVDDGSTDGSGAICEDYAARDSRIRVIHQANGGLSAARNAGLDVATGDYVLMPDGDDVLHPQFVSLARKALQQGDFPFAMVWAAEIRSAADFSSQPLASVPLRLLSQGAFVGGLTNRSAMGVNCHVAWNKLYRRATIANHRFEDTAAEDTLFHAQLAMDIKSVVVVDAPLYGWRQREGSLSHGRSHTTKQADRLLSLLRCMEVMPKGSRYATWFRECLSHDIPSVLALYQGTPLETYARQVVKKVKTSLKA